MKVAIALRTCDSVANYWNTERAVKATKPEIVLTCLNSLAKSIKLSKHEIIFSIHDDNSSATTIKQIANICINFNIKTDFYNCEKLSNFKSQYRWVEHQECDYIYCVEDDYLHTTNAIDNMVEICEHMQTFLPGEYAVYPFNNPHRYNSSDMLYPSYIIRGKDRYWRSSFHSTHTFFISKNIFLKNKKIMEFQAYEWPSLNAIEDNTINKIWREQEVRLLCPLNSIAYHLADKTQEDDLNDWKKIWEDNYYEVR